MNQDFTVQEKAVFVWKKNRAEGFIWKKKNPAQAVSEKKNSYKLKIPHPPPPNDDETFIYVYAIFHIHFFKVLCSAEVLKIYLQIEEFNQQIITKLLGLALNNS